MENRLIEKNGDSISPLGFGAMRLSLNGREYGESRRLLRIGINNGINFIDTAYVYSNGNNEKLIADALKDGYREKVKISTKIPAFNIKRREEMEPYLNKQLKTLGMDYIDYYFLHNVNLKIMERLSDIEVFEFLDKSKKEGKIRNAGFSYHGEIKDFKKVVDMYDWDMCLIQFNYYDDGIQMDMDCIEYAHSKKMGIFVMEPLKGGILAGDMPEKVEEEFRKVNPKKTNAEWALSWVLNHPEITCVLSGMTDIEQLRENIRIAKELKPNSLSDEELKTIKHARNMMKKSLKINCATCGYCMPCPEGVNIPQCFDLYNEKFLFNKKDLKARTQYLTQLGGALDGNSQNAGKCSQCNKCVRLCTQHLNIPEELKKVKSEFEYPGFNIINGIGKYVVLPVANRIFDMRNKL